MINYYFNYTDTNVKRLVFLLRQAMDQHFHWYQKLLLMLNVVMILFNTDEFHILRRECNSNHIFRVILPPVYLCISKNVGRYGLSFEQRDEYHSCGLKLDIFLYYAAQFDVLTRSLKIFIVGFFFGRNSYES